MVLADVATRRMSLQPSVTAWIASLKAADAEAAQRLWDRYSTRLVELARRKLGHAPKGIADEEDIAQSVFRNVCHGAAAGRFGDIMNRDDLWWLLLAITKKKVVDHVRRETAQKRGTGRVQSETVLAAVGKDTHRFSLDHLVGEEPTPEFLIMLEEEVSGLLASLRDDQLRQIAVWRIEGYTASEIADDLAISVRSVERKLQLIRITWSQNLAGVNARHE